MRNVWRDLILLFLIIAVFKFGATDGLWAASYGCFKDSSASVDVPGNAGICVTTPQGMLCSLDMTDCIIPSDGTGCPNLPNISYDATTNQCVVPPVCRNGIYDTGYHQCVVTSTGTCPAGSTQAASGLCTAAPAVLLVPIMPHITSALLRRLPIVLPGHLSTAQWVFVQDL